MSHPVQGSEEDCHSDSEKLMSFYDLPLDAKYHHFVSTGEHKHQSHWIQGEETHFLWRKWHRLWAAFYRQCVLLMSDAAFVFEHCSS
jgi:hypothetical protein